MPGTRIGGKKCAETNKERYGDDFYIKIGTMGGKKSRGGGFAYDRQKASEAGRKGGRASRRTAVDKVKTEARDTEAQHRGWRARIFK